MSYVYHILEQRTKNKELRTKNRNAATMLPIIVPPCLRVSMSPQREPHTLHTRLYHQRLCTHVFHTTRSHQCAAEVPLCLPPF